LQGELAHAKNLKRKEINAVFQRFSEITKEVDVQEQEFEERARKRKQLREDRWKNTPKRLGSKKFTPQVQVLCTDELPEDLRTLVPKFNLMEDRFNNLKERSMLAHNALVVRNRRYKQKHVELYRSREYRLEQEKLYSDK